MNARKALWSLCLCAAAGVVLADDSAAPESGVWVKRSYNLQFMGFTSTYSCDGLADKLKVLLKAAGARPDLKVTSGACPSGFGRPDKFANAMATFYVLVPVSQAKADEASGPTAQGTWQSVQMADHQPRELQRGDCELIEQFRDHVLPLFSQRMLDNQVTCIPNQESGSQYLLRFEVFRPAAGKPS